MCNENEWKAQIFRQIYGKIEPNRFGSKWIVSFVYRDKNQMATEMKGKKTPSEQLFICDIHIDDVNCNNKK